MNYKQRLKSLSLVLLFSGAFSLSAENVNDTSRSIDGLVEKVMETFQVPGVGIGIIKDGEVIHLKGYGIANIDKGNKVNKDTIFKIASNSKAFTSAGLALLVEQGKLNWRDKVIKYLPNFKMYDPWVTSEFNVIDLLTHRSGLHVGAGDLMLWPEPTKFTRSEVVNNLRYLKPVASFRDKYAYDNLLYIVAGELITAISGQPWEEFISENIFKPLAMNNCYAGGIDTQKITNLVAPHVVIAGKLNVDNANLINGRTSLMAAAGGIKCSANELLKWVGVHLNDGKTSSGKALFSKQQRDTMWKAITTLPLSAKQKSLDKANYRGYALGWRVSDYHGHWTVSHTGTLSGSMSKIIMLPEQNLGIVILTNQQSSSARNALSRGITQEFISTPKVDWVEYFVSAKKKAMSKPKDHKDSTFWPDENPLAEIIDELESTNNYLGTYVDPWFGTISLSKVNDQIMFTADKSPRLKGSVHFYKENQWWVKWDDRSFEADAWLMFKPNDDSNTVGLTMKSIELGADFSFDFEDLNFKKQ